jgi:hypothetical protein
MTEKKVHDPIRIDDKDLDEASGGIQARVERIRGADASANEAGSANNLKQLSLGATADGSF